jgi:hypothetical protein
MRYSNPKKKHLFLDISSTNDTLVPSLYQCVETRNRSLLTVVSATSAPPFQLLPQRNVCHVSRPRYKPLIRKLGCSTSISSLSDYIGVWMPQIFDAIPNVSLYAYKSWEFFRETDRDVNIINISYCWSSTWHLMLCLCSSLPGKKKRFRYSECTVSSVGTIVSQYSNYDRIPFINVPTDETQERCSTLWHE